MTKEKFKEYFKLEAEVSKRTSVLYKNRIDLIDYNDSFYGIIKLLGEELFTVDGWDHVSDFELEYDDDKYSRENPICWDAETSEPHYWDIDSLYDYLVKAKYITIK